MVRSGYIADLRAHVGSRLLVVAAVREVWEELGVGVDVGGVIDSFGGSDLVHEYANGERVA